MMLPTKLATSQVPISQLTCAPTTINSPAPNPSSAFRVTGPFVAMIRYMIVRDLRQFSLIYLVFLYSFAQCIFFINFQQESSREQLAADSQSPGNDERHFLLDLIVSYVELCMELFKMTLGVYDLQPYRHSSLARLFFLLFIYLIPILFNM